MAKNNSGKENSEKKESTNFNSIKNSSIITIIDLVLKTEHAIDVENPLCPKCGKKMHLCGKGRSVGTVIGAPAGGIGGGVIAGGTAGTAGGAAAGAKLFAVAGGTAGGPVGAAVGAVVGLAAGAVFGAFLGHMWDKHIKQKYRCSSCQTEYITK